MKVKSGQKVALVLSGGGARGLAHIGVIEELENRGYQITSVAGTSMGSLVGGIYARGKLPEFKEWITSLDRLKVFSLVDFTLSANGLIKGDKAFNAMKEIAPDVNIEDLPIPFSATAADITNHKEIVYRSGSLYKAIRASVAIPTVLTPVIENDAVIVDGGVLNNVPITNITRTENDMLVTVYVNANIPVKKAPQSKKEEKEARSAYLKRINSFNEQLHKILPHRNKKEKLGYFSLIDKTINTGMLRLAQLAIEQGKPDVLINISRDACGTYDFYLANELIEMGRHAAQKTLDK